jgi:biopolymer transport protein ExbB
MDHVPSSPVFSFSTDSVSGIAMRNIKSAVSLGLFALMSTALTPLTAHAWWNGDWKHRTKVTLNTTSAGVETKAAESGVTVPVRLHSGNFDFLSAAQDGGDLRFVAADDKTPLKYTVERFDATNELALVWVQVPAVAPGTDKNVVYAYFGNEKAKAEAASPAEVFDSNTVAALHFGEKDGVAISHNASLKAAAVAGVNANGLLGASAKLEGQPLSFAASDKVKAASGAPYTVSLWVKPTAVKGQIWSQGGLQLNLDGDKVAARLGALQISGGPVAAATWTHVAIALGASKAVLYVNGAEVAQGDLPAGAPAVEGPIAIGQGYAGEVDEVQVATAVRSADWVKLAAAAQRGDAKLVASVSEAEDSAGEGEGGEGGYMGILIKSLTPDAKAVIAILAVMFVVAVWVMITKAMLVGKADKDNLAFLKRFRNANEDLLSLGKGAAHPNSSLFRLYQAGVRELDKRQVGQAGSQPLGGASIDAVKAAIDADLVRENHHLNARMVLLTIAISGGPFLGLLGTVVGVMITFAAIAAAGDVNVNAIAPGIAAALLATVAGLGVAIPALFGYNYLASRIKNISSDMQIFVDEFVTRVAERYGAR